MKKKIARFLRSISREVRRVADNLESPRIHASRLSDPEFLQRLADRPSWHRHRSRLLRIADKIS